jgi:ketosteroid isomerase-like protein
MKRLLSALSLLIVITGCDQSPPTSDGSVLAARGEAWEAALNAKDIDALVALYEDDARIMPPNAPMSSGHDAVRADFGAMIEAGLTAELTSIDGAVSGDIGYNLGTYKLMSGDTQVDAGKYMETWHRGDDGQWRYTNDIYNSDLPVPAPVADMPMTHLMISHEVEDADRWLAAWAGENSRHKLFMENGAAHVHTFQNPDNPNLTGLVVAVSDMAALTAMLESEQGRVAAAYDGVIMETMTMFVQTE